MPVLYCFVIMWLRHTQHGIGCLANAMKEHVKLRQIGRKINNPKAKVRIIFELDDNNLKDEPFTPSKSHIVHKNTYYTITKNVQKNGKVCAHLRPSICTCRHVPNNTLKYEGTFIGIWRYLGRPTKTLSWSIESDFPKKQTNWPW